LTSSQKVASALFRAERALRNWQDDPDSPRADVDKMLAIIADLRAWVHGHVMDEIEHPESTRPFTIDRSLVIPEDILLREPIGADYNEDEDLDDQENAEEKREQKREQKGEQKGEQKREQKEENRREGS